MNPLRGMHAIRILLVLSLCGLAGGCALFGLAAYAAPDPTVDAGYKNLAHQKVAVMVWTDRAMSIDWPQLQLDLARGIESRLQEAAAKKKDAPRELLGTTLAAPESVVRYQRDHPETETESIIDVAPRMDISRLIYIEVQQFSTRPEESLELYRGSLTANLKVLEITNGRAKVAFQVDNMHVVFPPKSPEEGLPGVGDAQVYERTLEAFSTQVVNQFIPHTEPRER